MRHRRAEERHNRVADELLHRAPEALELRAQMSVIWGEQRTHVLRVHRLGPGREADQVAEETGDDLPLLAGGARPCLSQGRGTEGAKRKLPIPRQLLTATRAVHPPSLGRRVREARQAAQQTT